MAGGVASATDDKDGQGRGLVPVNKNLGNVKAEHGAHPSVSSLRERVFESDGVV